MLKELLAVTQLHVDFSNDKNCRQNNSRREKRQRYVNKVKINKNGSKRKQRYQSTKRSRTTMSSTEQQSNFKPEYNKSVKCFAIGTVTESWSMLQKKVKELGGEMKTINESFKAVIYEFKSVENAIKLANMEFDNILLF